MPVDEEFQKLWRSVAVDAMDDAKIDEYLEKQGKNIDCTFIINNLIISNYIRYQINARSWT